MNTPESQKTADPSDGEGLRPGKCWTTLRKTPGRWTRCKASPSGGCCGSTCGGSSGRSSTSAAAADCGGGAGSGRLRPDAALPPPPRRGAGRGLSVDSHTNPTQRPLRRREKKALFSFVQLLRRWITRASAETGGGAAVPPADAGGHGGSTRPRARPTRPSWTACTRAYSTTPPTPTAVPAYVQGLDQGEFTQASGGRGVRQLAGGRAGRSPGRLSAVPAPRDQAARSVLVVLVPAGRRQPNGARRGPDLLGRVLPGPRRDQRRLP